MAEVERCPTCSAVGCGKKATNIYIASRLSKSKPRHAIKVRYPRCDGHPLGSAKEVHPIHADPPRPHDWITWAPACLACGQTREEATPSCPGPPLWSVEDEGVAKERDEVGTTTAVPIGDTDQDSDANIPQEPANEAGCGIDAAGEVSHGTGEGEERERDHCCVECGITWGGPLGKGFSPIMAICAKCRCGCEGDPEPCSSCPDAPLEPEVGGRMAAGIADAQLSEDPKAEGVGEVQRKGE